MKWQGGFATYLRLVIPEISCVDRLIYLDCDLLVFCDLTELAEVPLEGRPLGAVSWHDAHVSNDGRFLESLGMDTSKPYFNAGVLLVDVKRWKCAGITERCMALGDRYGTSLPTADQTLLNIVFHSSFTELPRKFNTPVEPGRAPLAPHVWQNRVIHLVSHPKPWDLWGGLNGQSKLFRIEFAKTALPPRSADIALLKRLQRTVRWSMPYWKCIRQRLRGG